VWDKKMKNTPGERQAARGRAAPDERSGQNATRKKETEVSRQLINFVLQYVKTIN